MKIRNYKLYRRSLASLLTFLVLIGATACGNKRTVREELSGDVYGTVTVPLVLSAVGVPSNIREERVAYNFVSDAVMSYFLTNNIAVDVALITTASSRGQSEPNGTYPAGEWTEGMTKRLMPLSNKLVVVTVTGVQLISIFEHVASRLHQTAATTFMIPSKAMRVVYNLSGVAQVRNATNTAIISEGTRVASLKLNGVEINPTGIYKVGTLDFLSCVSAACQAGNGALNDGYVAFREASSNLANVLQTGVMDYEAIKAYLRNASPVTPVVDGRIAGFP